MQANYTAVKCTVAAMPLRFNITLPGEEMSAPIHAGRLVQSGRGSFVNATVNSQSYFTNLQVCPASSG